MAFWLAPKLRLSEAESGGVWVGSEVGREGCTWAGTGAMRLPPCGKRANHASNAKA